MSVENMIGWALLVGVPFLLVYGVLKYKAYRERKEQEEFDREFAKIEKQAALRRERSRMERNAFESRSQVTSTTRATSKPRSDTETRQSAVVTNTDDFLTQTVLMNALTSSLDTFGANVVYDSNDRPTIVEVPRSTWSSSDNDDSPSKSSSWSSSSDWSSSSSSDTGSSSSWD